MKRYARRIAGILIKALAIAAIIAVALLCMLIMSVWCAGGACNY